MLPRDYKVFKWSKAILRNPRENYGKECCRNNQSFFLCNLFKFD